VVSRPVGPASAKPQWRQIITNYLRKETVHCRNSRTTSIVPSKLGPLLGGNPELNVLPSACWTGERRTGLRCKPLSAVGQTP
jgi:hypothetical protein